MLFIIINLITTYFAIGYGLYLWRAYKTISENLTEDDPLFIEKDFASFEIVFWPFILLAIFAMKLKRYLIDTTWNTLERKYNTKLDNSHNTNLDSPQITLDEVSNNSYVIIDGILYCFRNGEWTKGYYDR